MDGPLRRLRLQLKQIRIVIQRRDQPHRRIGHRKGRQHDQDQDSRFGKKGSRPFPVTEEGYEQPDHKPHHAGRQIAGPGQGEDQQGGRHAEQKAGPPPGVKLMGTMITHQEPHQKGRQHQRQVTGRHRHRMEHKIIPVKIPGPKRPSCHREDQGADKVQDDPVAEDRAEPLPSLPGKEKQVQKAEGRRQIDGPAPGVSEQDQKRQEAGKQPAVNRGKPPPFHLFPDKDQNQLNQHQPGDHEKDGVLLRQPVLLRHAAVLQPVKHAGRRGDDGPDQVPYGKERLLFTHGKQHQPQEDQHLPVGIGLLHIIHRVHVIDTAPERAGPEDRLQGVHSPIQQIFPHGKSQRTDIIPLRIHRVEKESRQNEDSGAVHHLVRPDAPIVIEDQHGGKSGRRPRRDQRIAHCPKQPLHSDLPALLAPSRHFFRKQHKKAGKQGDPRCQRSLCRKAERIRIGKAHEDVLPDLLLRPAFLHQIIIPVNRQSRFAGILPAQRQLLLRMADLPDVGSSRLCLKLHRNGKKSRSAVGIQRHVPGKQRLSQIIGNGKIDHLPGQIVFRENADAFQISAVREENLLDAVIRSNGFRPSGRRLISRHRPDAVQDPCRANKQDQYRRPAQNRVFDCPASFQLSVHDVFSILFPTSSY